MSRFIELRMRDGRDGGYLIPVDKRPSEEETSGILEAVAEASGTQTEQWEVRYVSNVSEAIN
jgi:hypothetical protein